MKKKNDETPETFFWKNPQKNSRIKIVNPHDFTMPEIIGKLRGKNFVPDSFGITDTREIQLRNEISSYLIDRPELVVKIANWKMLAEKYQSLPRGENEFLFIYKQDRNPYWDLIREVIAEFDEPTTPRRLKGFAELLKSALPLEARESDMAKRISEKLEKVTEMEGMVEIAPFGESKNLAKFVTGVKSYSAEWSDYEIKYPKWTSAFLAKITGIGRLAKRIIKENAKAKANRSAAILEFPSSVYGDLNSGLENIIAQILPPPPPEPKIETPLPDTTAKPKPRKRRVKIDPREIFYHNLQNRYDLVFTVTFRYNSDGLKLRVIGMNRAAREDKFEFSFADFEGYTQKEKAKAVQIREIIRARIKESRQMMGILETYNELEKYVGLFSKHFEVASPGTDAALKWYALNNLYASKENIATYQELNQQRRKFASIMGQLKSFSAVVEMFRAEAQKLDIPLCVPEIREKGNVGVSFNGMAPINMWSQGAKMVPFTMPIINGRMICLTGRHGGGKSVAGQSVIENIYLAQSGLPVFAESFSLDVKTVLGSVTNDTGDGSTATVFVEKVKNLFSEIAKVPKEQSLIFIDEIGKGTQENHGFNLGLNILTALKGREYSVIFNTQIMRLAEHAQNELGAICLKVDKDHTFSEGIGDGQMDQLVKESGLDQFFIKN